MARRPITDADRALLRANYHLGIRQVAKLMGRDSNVVRVLAKEMGLLKAKSESWEPTPEEIAAECQKIRAEKGDA